MAARSLPCDQLLEAFDVAADLLPEFHAVGADYEGRGSLRLLLGVYLRVVVFSNTFVVGDVDFEALDVGHCLNYGLQVLGGLLRSRVRSCFLTEDASPH